jgi:actin-related protein
VNHHKRITAAEVIFDPSLATDPALRSVDGVASIAHMAIEKCDSDLKSDLYNNIVLAGGTTLMKGFTERFDNEIRNLAYKTDISVSAALHRRYAAWIGGSMLASFSTFSDTAIKKSDYEDTSTENNRSSCILKKTVF